MPHGKTQTTLRRALVLCNKALNLEIGSSIHLDKDELCFLFRDNNVGIHEARSGYKRTFSKDNVLNSICSEVERMSCSWLFAIPDGDGGVVLTNTFTHKKTQRKNKINPDRHKWMLDSEGNRVRRENRIALAHKRARELAGVA